MTHLVESFRDHFYIGLYLLLLIDTIGLPPPGHKRQPLGLALEPTHAVRAQPGGLTVGGA